MPRTESHAKSKPVLEKSSEDSTTLDLDEVSRAVADVAATIDGDDPSVATRLTNEIATLAEVIQGARREIAALNSKQAPDRDFVTANDELDAVVGATEEATLAIMESAEAIEALAEELEEDPAKKLTDAVTAIYEACGFQDITGQRIAKVVGALREIESKVDRLMAAFGDRDARSRQEHLNAELIQPQHKPGNPLLSGPQSKDVATNQDDIDAIFENLD